MNKEINDLVEAKALIELKEKDLFKVIMESASQTIKICKLRTKLIEKETTIKTLKEIINKMEIKKQ